MAKIGPFFFINGNLIINSCSLAEGRQQADKLDNSYSHEQLYDDHYRYGDYINYPRGRVIWDITNETAIIYIDPCINNTKIINMIVQSFDLQDFCVMQDEHYRCKKCINSHLI